MRGEKEGGMERKMEGVGRSEEERGRGMGRRKEGRNGKKRGGESMRDGGIVGMKGRNKGKHYGWREEGQEEGTIVWMGLNGHLHVRAER